MLKAAFGILKLASARLAVAAAVILAVATLVFFAMHLIQGSYVDLFFPLATPEQRAEISARYGLDQPLIYQYAIWLGDVLHGDFGTSLVSKKPVLSELARRLPLTLELGLLALAIILFVGLPMGILAGLFHKSPVSQSGRIGATALMSVPDFVLGSFFVWLFSSYDLTFKAGGWVPISQSLSENLQHALLPALVLSATGIGLIIATARSGVLRVIGQDHILAAVSRGAAPTEILRRHILRNTLVPVVTMLAVIAGYLLGGAVLVETVFNLDGVGRLIVTSISARDYPVVQAGVILTSTIFVVLNTAVDLFDVVIDPRVRRA